MLAPPASASPEKSARPGAAVPDSTSPKAASHDRVAATPCAPSPPFTPEQAECETHGPYPLNAIDADGTVRWHTPHCPACVRVRAAEKLLARAAIAPRFAHCRFDNFITRCAEQQAVLQTCRDYARHFSHWRKRGLCLILSGAPGTGKNHLATAIAGTLLDQGHTVLNATAHEIVRRIRDTWPSNGGGRQAGDGACTAAPETEMHLVREFAVADLLIIDEVGRSYQNREGNEPVELFNVIDARYRQLRPTLVLSNQDGEGIQQALGMAAYDRLREGGGQLLRFTWESYRQRRPAGRP